MTKVAAVAAKVKQVGKRLDPSHYFVPFLLETPGHLHAINGVATTVTVGNRQNLQTTLQLTCCK